MSWQASDEFCTERPRPIGCCDEDQEICLLCEKVYGPTESDAEDDEMFCSRAHEIEHDEESDNGPTLVPYGERKVSL